jgi:pantoate--beta-alanine ligase
VQIIRKISRLRDAVNALRTDGPIALVPTMGALHAGHMALVAEARRRAPHVVASIFVNPMQFGANEDLSTYPRAEAADSEMLASADVAILWAPDVETVYPRGFVSKVSVGGGISETLDGEARPGHFDGVATVVAKLFNQVRPDIALFGEKDFQQLAIIRRMVEDLDLPIEIVAVPTQRDADGLALSSRNAYLSPLERQSARALPRVLGEAVQAIAAGGDIQPILAEARTRLLEAGFDSVDYVELRDPETLEPVVDPARPSRLLAAAKIGRTRLIDNFAVPAVKSSSPTR